MTDFLAMGEPDRLASFIGIAVAVWSLGVATWQAINVKQREAAAFAGLAASLALLAGDLRRERAESAPRPDRIS